MPTSCVLVKNNTNEFVDIKIVTESMAVWRFIIVCIITSNREQMKFYFTVKAQFINLFFYNYFYNLSLLLLQQENMWLDINEIKT